MYRSFAFLHQRSFNFDWDGAGVVSGYAELLAQLKLVGIRCDAINAFELAIAEHRLLVADVNIVCLGLRFFLLIFELTLESPVVNRSDVEEQRCQETRNCCVQCNDEALRLLGRDMEVLNEYANNKRAKSSKYSSSEKEYSHSNALVAYINRELNHGDGWRHPAFGEQVFHK